MGSKPWQPPAPTYRTLETFWDTDEDAPGPRCGHTLTAVAATKTQGPRLILFGGATAIEGGSSSSSPGIRLAGVTNSVHSYDVLTKKWTRIRPAGDPPSPRAAHAATVVGTMVVFQGGIGPAGHSTDDLYVLDLTNYKFKWHRVVVQGQGPGPRYGHVMDLVSQRYLVTVSGNDGKRVLSDAWALDTGQKPYIWQKLNTEGDRPSARMYATANARSDGMFLLCGGRDSSGTPMADAYGLLMHRNGQWEWTLAPGAAPSPRYQHAAVFVGVQLHVTGGALRGGRAVEGEAAIAVLDTAAGEWLDRNGLAKGHDEYDASLELMRRCRHASASVGARIYVHGGLRGDTLLDDFLVAEYSPFQSDINSPVLTPEKVLNFSGPRFNNESNFTSFETTSDDVPDFPSAGGMIMDEYSMERLKEASVAEAEAANAVWQAAQAASAVPSVVSVSDENSHAAETASDASEIEADVRLHYRAVVVAKEAVGNLGGMIRQLSLDQFENESRRMIPSSDLSYSAKKPRNWKAPANRRFFLDSYEVGELCFAAEQIFMQEPSVLQLKAPIKVFGDLHGQFGDLMRLFDEYGFPSTAGDITYIDYLFLGDYIEYPENVHLIRGNHEASDINALFGFRIECIERMGENDGIWAWTRFNQLFNCIPLAALIEKKIICMHGGIGRSIHAVEQIEKLERPITMDAGSIVLMDLSDPTENDSIEGLRPNARGPGLVTFGPDRVADFCKKNRLQLIIRAHECVMDGFERFAHGQLITLFSATNYCGTANNAGAILVVGRGLVVVPKLIHPLPPPIHSPEASPERVGDDAWMQELNIQRPPTPTRGRPQPEVDRNSLAYI
ncbi:Serine/threonine-protein phosphatase BSL1 -like protein [Gossypium arboreum]|uniref:Serine/threonine-protein phosphatase n=1 Tax=Gossypium arboreum TaxID=29729 RepID=A0A0B0NUT8_GOSAR|nr:Serine/threonine-protein phosphatase BSL1 -like protein [Gossypium arboreum]